MGVSIRKDGLMRLTTTSRMTAATAAVLVGMIVVACVATAPRAALGQAAPNDAGDNPGGTTATTPAPDNAPAPETTPAPAVTPTRATATRKTSTLAVGVGRSSLITAPLPTKTVSIGDPKIADVQILSPTQLLISGKGVGTTDLILFDANGQAEQLEVLVAADGAGALAELRRLFPDSDIDVRQSRDTLVVSGKLARIEDGERLKKFMDTSGVKWVDMTTLAGVQQVQIKITIAEANRVAIRALAINVGYSDGRSFGASNIDLGQFGLATVDQVHVFGDKDPTNAITLFGRAFVGDTLIEAFLAALAENQYLRVLAEPSLVALSGEEANFLAGGEFPIPVVQGTGSTAGGGTAVTIEYKTFGVQLHFRPTVTGEGNIRLHVAPEVSELSNEGAVTLQGFSIPGLNTRRAETTLELKSGQSFGMAGLISQSTQAKSSRVPGLGDIPVIGSMFRSVRYQQGDTELLVVVTAALVEPLSVATRPPVPSQFHAAPNDWEVYGLAHVEGSAAPQMTPADKQWLRDRGLDRLKGPGAWVTFDTKDAVTAAPEQPVSGGGNAAPAKK
jgi:pilus assembly protein CpaC